MTSSKTANIAFPIIFGISFIAFSFLYLQYGVDDSFITFRYANNFVKHGIWNWNSSGERVEAYTNFSYAILSILPEILEISPLIFSKLLGGCLFLWISIRTYKIIGPQLRLWLLLGFVFLNPIFYVHSYSGLETSLFVVLLFEILIRVSDKKSNWPDRHLFILMLLLSLTRPEGVFFSLMAFGCYYNNQKKIESKATLAIIITLSFIYFYLRYSYFGQILPNTFYVKSGASFSWYRFFGYIAGSAPFWGAPLLFIFVKNTNFRVLLSSSIIVNLYYACSDLQMNYEYRFPFQTLMPFYLAAIYLAESKNRLHYVSVVVALSLGAIWGAQNTRATITYYPRLQQSYGALGSALSKFRADNLKLVSGDVGLIPYYSGWNTLDFIGLASEQVARRGLSIKTMEEYNPDLILVYSVQRDGFSTGFDNIRNMEIVRKFLTNNEEFELVGAVKLDDKFFLQAYLKKSTKKFIEIKKSIAEVENKSMNFKLDAGKYFSLYYLKYPD